MSQFFLNKAHGHFINNHEQREKAHLSISCSPDKRSVAHVHIITPEERCGVVFCLPPVLPTGRTILIDVERKLQHILIGSLELDKGRDCA